MVTVKSESMVKQEPVIDIEDVYLPKATDRSTQELTYKHLEKAFRKLKHFLGDLKPPSPGYSSLTGRLGARNYLTTALLRKLHESRGLKLSQQDRNACESEQLREIYSLVGNIYKTHAGMKARYFKQYTPGMASNADAKLIDAGVQQVVHFTF